MTPQKTPAPFAPSAQGQPQAATRGGWHQASHALAERHEALWLALDQLHRDTLALGGRKPQAPVSDGQRVAAETLLSDCVPFLPTARRSRLPVAAADMAGLAVQLGQALAALDAWEAQRSYLDRAHNCRMWRLPNDKRLPIMRLNPPAAALPDQGRSAVLRERLAKLIDARNGQHFQNGFEAGRRARDGQPVAEIEEQWRKTYPRLRLGA